MRPSISGYSHLTIHSAVSTEISELNWIVSAILSNNLIQTVSRRMSSPDYLLATIRNGVQLPAFAEIYFLDQMWANLAISKLSVKRITVSLFHKCYLFSVAAHGFSNFNYLWATFAVMHYLERHAVAFNLCHYEFNICSYALCRTTYVVSIYMSLRILFSFHPTMIFLRSSLTHHSYVYFMKYLVLHQYLSPLYNFSLIVSFFLSVWSVLHSGEMSIAAINHVTHTLTERSLQNNGSLSYFLLPENIEIYVTLLSLVLQWKSMKSNGEINIWKFIE